MGDIKSDYILNRAHTAVVSRDFQLASRLYKTALQSNPGSIDILLKLAACYVRASQDKNACNAYLCVLKIQPDNFEALNSLGGVYRRLGQYEESIKVLEKALETGKNAIEVEYNMGFTYKLMGKYDKAISCFDYVIAENPNDVLAYNHIGTIYAKQNAHAKALQFYQRALQIDENHPVLHFNSAVSYCAVGNYEGAEFAYEKALRVRPDWIDAMVGLSELYIREKKYKDAAEVLDQALLIKPGDKQLLVSNGKVCSYLGNYSEAEKSYLRVLQTEETNQDALLGLESVYETEGRTDDAFGILNKMVRVMPENKHVAGRYVKILIDKNYLEEAYAQLEKMNAAGSEDTLLLNLLGQYYTRKNDFERAENCFRKISMIAPDNIAYIRDSAVQLMRMGDLQKAETRLQNYLGKNPSDAEALAALGEVYERGMNYENALKSYKASLEFNPKNPVVLAAVSRIAGRISQDEKAMSIVSEIINTKTDQFTADSLGDSIRMYEDSVGNSDFSDSETSENVDDEPLESIDYDEVLQLDMKDDYQLPDDTDDLKLSMNAEDFDLNKEPPVDELSLDKLIPDDMPIEYDASKKKDDITQLEGGGRKYNPNEKDEYLDVDGDPFEEETIYPEDTKKEEPPYPYPPVYAYPPQDKQPEKPQRSEPLRFEDENIKDSDLEKPIDAEDEPVSDELEDSMEDDIPEEEIMLTDDIPEDEPEAEEISDEPAEETEEPESEPEETLPEPEEAAEDEFAEDDDVTAEEEPEIEEIPDVEEEIQETSAEPEIEDALFEEEPSLQIEDEPLPDEEETEDAEPEAEEPDAVAEEAPAEEPYERPDEETTMRLVSGALQTVLHTPRRRRFKTTASMFTDLRALCEWLPEKRKQAFFNDLNSLKLDFVIERLSGKPGLLSVASVLRSSEGITETETAEGKKPSLLKTMEYMRTLFNDLPDKHQAGLLNNELSRIIDNL